MILLGNISRETQGVIDVGESEGKSHIVRENIIRYLYVDVYCAGCHRRLSVSLATLGAPVQAECPYCKLTMTLFDGSNKIRNFAAAFDEVYQHLDNIGLLPLSFAPCC